MFGIDTPVCRKISFYDKLGKGCSEMTPQFAEKHVLRQTEIRMVGSILLF